jgi:hypothetical protein
MTQDEIIRMAREAGLRQWWDSGNEDWDDFIDHIERFATLVAEATKEKAAKVCEEVDKLVGYDLAAAIRLMK